MNRIYSITVCKLLIHYRNLFNQFNQKILNDNYKFGIMQTNNNLYDQGETTSSRLQLLIVIRVLLCVFIVTRESCHLV